MFTLATLAVSASCWSQASLPPPVPVPVPISAANAPLPSADSVSSVAARIQQDENEARTRCASVRYLGMVDCNYWPEAGQALKKALRGDRNESVRYEAALALQNGRCCNQEIIGALRVTVLGLTDDGYPAETSERVRQAATSALSRCLALMVAEMSPGSKEKKDGPNEYYKNMAEMPREQVIAMAKDTMNQLQDRVPSAPRANPVSFESQASPPYSAASNFSAPGAPTVAAAAPKRRPFLANLTRMLTGRQDSVASQSNIADPVPVVPPPPVPYTLPSAVNQPQRP
jgi:hypothetical protein